MLVERAPEGIEPADNSDSAISIVSKDGQKFHVTRSVAVMSEYIKSCLELDQENLTIPLKNVEGQVLKPIVDWMVYHSSTPSRVISRPLHSSNLVEIVGLWDAEYVEAMSLELTFQVLLAANYLNLQSLVELCCAKVASLMLGKTPKQIRKTFNVRDDFTPEEESQIRQEFAEFL
uniref:SKP1 component POZ domain-containing protein n=1 Tax=Spongospora subterranea TaxID=70186 RepID=A0A0H5RL30_9EUKA|eukprot:CRZ09429.1 hypothetical protein [Spongospora subterranea]